MAFFGLICSGANLGLRLLQTVALIKERKKNSICTLRLTSGYSNIVPRAPAKRKKMRDPGNELGLLSVYRSTFDSFVQFIFFIFC